ncbi:valine-tRNA ligase [Rhizoctonia solani]|uniref:Valine-tRNA ligase n=1 Tax=Rhizoctonia solani TaxID=456999 RepID=A0A8H8SY95_9AGAM|nr:valine-tRNA ligase [Rhizoctonia solani]QRW21357.1 valine-tRNA ligase [Rhizoctonia solani]
MSNPPRFNIVVWNTNRPERPHRERPNTRAPNNFSHVMNFGHNRDSNPPSSSPSASPPSTSTSYSYSHSDSYWDSYTNPYQNNQPQMEISTPASPHLSPIEQLAPFSSCEISDALIKIGLTHNAKDAPIQRGGYIPDINMLSPSPTVGDGQNTRICGYAYTVKMVRGDDLHAPKPSQHFVDAAPSGSIAVISVPPNVKSAAWGGLMTAGAQFRGVNGVIIDGRVRDLIEHRAAGFPVFARGHSTLGQSPFTRPSELNVPVTILPRSDFENAFENTFSAVEVHPGDIIVADIDGVVCIPRELLANVIDSCRYSKQVDEKCMIDIQQGRSIQETFQHWQAQKLWEERAQNALNELETGRSRPLRIGVWGDALSGASEIITALLDDPLSDDTVQRHLLHRRWDAAVQNQVIHIRKNSFASWDGQVLGIKSNWLQNINGEIIECRGRNALDTLLSCDHIILVTDNLRRISAPGLQEAIYALAHAPSVSLVVTERASGVPTVPDEFNGLKPTMIKPNLAIGGLDAFSKGDVSQYQTLLMASGLPQFTQQISSMYAESNQPSSPSSTASRAAVRTSTYIARMTFSACESAIDNAQQSLVDMVTPLVPLKTEVSKISLDATQSTLRGSTTVHEGISSVEARLKSAFLRLPWYSLWWRADEVSSVLGEAISWSSLGTQLSFHSGRLAIIREQMHSKAQDLAKLSPLLKNQLAQIHARTTINSGALSSPLFQRTAQLLAPGGPAEDAQRKAQAAVVAAAANILGSAALSASLFSIGSISGGTAIGAGLLGSVASVRWMQSMWARAEKRWWADWSRVCAGLERECEANLDQVIHERVMGSVTAGIQGIEALSARRTEIISALKQEMSEIDKDLVVLEQRLK